MRLAQAMSLFVHSIPLPLGVQVDEADLQLVQQHRWYVCETRNGARVFRYAKARIGGRVITLHRLLMQPAAGLQVDHVNGDGLDNRRQNLRLCTPAENSRNARRRADSSSGFKGVRRNGPHWWASIAFEGTRYGLGNYETPQTAHAAYSLAAQLLHGDFHNFG